MTDTLKYSVPGMTCEHCRTAITDEVTAVERVTDVQVDLETKQVTVHGDDVDDAAVRAAIHEAGYEVTT